MKKSAMTSFLLISLALLLAAGPNMGIASENRDASREEPPVETVRPVPLPLAEPYVRMLAESSQRRRISSGIESLGYGLVFGGLGVAAVSLSETSEERKIGTYLLVGGGVYVVLGVMDLAIKPKIEREYDRAFLLPADQRETVFASLLEDEARRARTGRYLGAALNAGLALFFIIVQPFADADYWGIGLSTNWNIYTAVTFGCLSLGSLIFQSREESYFKKYRAEKQASEGMGRLAFGIAPQRGGMALAMSYRF